MLAEVKRLQEHHRCLANWKLWGPYLSERAWGTVREDYSPDGDAWGYFTHDQARSRSYRWNEDGLFGFSDREQMICFSTALWNGKDPILKERLFGLSNQEGNHGEDVKECYYYLDSTPTHSYVKMLYKYPQKAYPYEELVEENKKRGRALPEYELIDTGVFDQNRYFDVFVEFAKVGCDDFIVEIAAYNRSDTSAPLHLLPTLWFRNTWSWGYPEGPMGHTPEKPVMRRVQAEGEYSLIQIEHSRSGIYYAYFDEEPLLLFTENETNNERLFGVDNGSNYVKDAFHRYLVDGQADAVNPVMQGTKGCAVYRFEVEPKGSIQVKMRLSKERMTAPFLLFEETMQTRQKEADQFYCHIQEPSLTPELLAIQRHAFAGLLCSKQLYYYDQQQWLYGDPSEPKPPLGRGAIRNGGWEHLVCFDVLSMPDKWEYPWFASWDLAFHVIPLGMVDPDFAKRQLTLMTREWYMHPNGALPAYEWNFSDVNPPVHAWATWRLYKIQKKIVGKGDRAFLHGIFNKLLLNFTWWVNRKDAAGRNIFQGGFLGLDNISLFDRSKPLPTGGYLDQSDATSWMGFYCLTMMKIALELAREEPIYQDTATKFFEHFLRIAGAMDSLGKRGLWDQKEGFFYDAIRYPNGRSQSIKVRSLVGLMPLLATEVLEQELFTSMPVFSRRVDWFLDKWPDLAKSMSSIYMPGKGHRKMMSIVKKEQLRRILAYMLDEDEFLAPYGIRSVSKFHKQHPFSLKGAESCCSVDYEPGESKSGLFGGNSNWRGPIWFPLNFLLIESLQKYHHYYGESFKVEFPTRSGVEMTLDKVAAALSERLISLFKRSEQGLRPFLGDSELLQKDPYWCDLPLFHEYFHAETGKGLGASHQTGWTALVAKLIQQSAYILNADN